MLDEYLLDRDNIELRNKIIVEHIPLIKSVCQKYKSFVDPEDLFQQAIELFIEGLSKYKPIIPFRGYIRFFLKKRLLDVIWAGRKYIKNGERQFYTVHSLNDINPATGEEYILELIDEQQERDYRVDKIIDEINKFPTHHRKLLNDHFFLNKTMVQIGKETGYSKQVISLRINKLINELKSRLISK